MKEQTENWNKGYKLGEKSVFEYLKEMWGNVLIIDTLKEDYELWCECEEYTNCKGERVNRNE